MYRNISNDNSCVAIYKILSEVEQSIRLLSQSDFDLAHLSILANGYYRHENTIDYYNIGIGEQIRFWSLQGAFWDNLWRQLSDSAFFWIPGIGPLAVGGPLVGMIIDGLEAKVADKINIMGIALYNIGIPNDSIIRYESAIKSKKFLVIIHGNQDEVFRAGDLLRTNKEADISVHIKTSFIPS